MKHKLLFLLFVLSVSVCAAYAQTTHWQYNPHDYEYDMTAYVVLQSESELSNYEIAAFCGAECRGVAEIIDAGQRQVGYLRIRSNTVSGEVITFKVFIKNSQEEVELDSAPVSFASNATLGTPSEPFQLQIAGVYIPGDVNGDNVIDALDASLILQYVAHKFGDENTDFIKEAADTNNDNVIDALDASLVLQHAAKKIDLNEINNTTE